jgi:hypothetical protein
MLVSRTALTSLKLFPFYIGLQLFQTRYEQSLIAFIALVYSRKVWLDVRRVPASRLAFDKSATNGQLRPSCKFTVCRGVSLEYAQNQVGSDRAMRNIQVHASSSVLVEMSPAEVQCTGVLNWLKDCQLLHCRAAGSGTLQPSHLEWCMAVL